MVTARNLHSDMQPRRPPRRRGRERERRLGRGAPPALALIALVVFAASALALEPGRGSRPAPAAHDASARSSCVPSRLNASDALGGTPLTVAPLPGSLDASPRTQISLLGAPASSITAISVRGSRTGTHRGLLRGYSQGDGASFLPAKPFRSGERVTVRGTVAAQGGPRAFTFSFVVAAEDPIAHVVVAHPIKDYLEKQHFASAPTVEPPAMVLTAASPGRTGGGYIFITPYNGPGPSGAMIFEESGNLVWFQRLPVGTEATNLQVQQLGGRPVLTWWQGYIPLQGFGQGEEIVADSSYRIIGRVRAGNGYQADLHDFHLQQDGTAVLTVFAPIACDLRADGGPRNAAVTDTIMQEVDLAGGLVRREWHSLDHVPLADSYAPQTGASREWPWDWFHLNSMQAQSDGTTLLSARNTSALYEVSTSTGQVLRRIGGKHSDVRMGAGTVTAYQHDAERRGDGAITVFDNGGVPQVHHQSRALALSVSGASASLLAQYVHPQPLFAGSQGNIQSLPGGDEFVGWGAQPYFSEFSANGALLFDAHLRGSYQSYRAYRFPWTGAPASAPAVAVLPASAPRAVYVSWNGDTRTARWRVLAGASASSLAQVAEAPRQGFETAIGLPAGESYVQVQALDAGGAVIGTSRITP